MASYTASLRLIQPATGEYPGSWGTQANNGLTALVDTSVAGTATITMTAADYTLSTANGASDEARAAVLSLGGTPGNSYNVIVPAVSKLYVVYNNTGHAQTVKTSAGTGISVPNAATAYLRCDGTNVVAALNYFGSLTVGTVTGGTFVSPALTGTPTAPTAAGGTSTTQIATTAFVATNFASLNSPAFTGTPTVPTAAPGTNTTQAASTAFVATSFAPLNSPAFTGVPTAPTATAGVSTTQVATTAFVSATAFSSALPGQTGNAGKYVTTDGTNASWADVYPSQTGNTGKVLETDGSTVSWQEKYPSQTGNNGRFLTTNGTSPSWSDINLTTSVTGTLPVGSGGTGASTLALNNVLLGNGTSSLQTVAPGASGNVLLSDGTTWSSSAFPVITDPAKVPTTVTANSSAPYYALITYQWSITNLDDYTTYTITTSNGSVSRSGATINYTPSSAGTGGFTINGRNISFATSAYTVFGSRTQMSGSVSGAGPFIAANSTVEVGSFRGQVNSLGATNGNVLIEYRNTIGTLSWSGYIYDPSATIQYQNAGIGLASDSQVLLCCQDNSNTRGYFIKIFTSGGLQWSRYLATLTITNSIVDSADNLIGLGYASGTWVLVKYNTTGTIQWQIKENGFLSVSGRGGLIADSSNNIYLGAFTDLIKFNSAGTLQFKTRIATTNLTGVVLDSAGNIYVSGYVGSNGYVFKFDSAGALLWQRVVTNVVFWSITIDSSDQVYTVGVDQSGSNSPSVIFKYNTSGTVQWQRSLTWNGASYQPAIKVSGTSYYLALTGGSSFIAQMVRLNTDGSLTTPSGSGMTYAASAYTEGAGALTTSASTATFATSTLTETTAFPGYTNPSTTTTLFRS